MPRVLLFDFGGTLDADGERWSVRFHRAYRSEGGALEFDRFEPVFRASDAALASLADVRRFGFRAMVEAQARLLLGLLPDGGALSGPRIAARFHEQAHAVAARNRPLLECLAARHRLGVVSNFTGNLEPCLTELGLRGLFETAVDSTVAGVAKPDPRIFELALAALGESARSAWMVGDNFDADIRPASTLGMIACWLAPPGRAEPEGGVAVRRIATLPDLREVLD